ncbi:YecA family protein [Ornithinibacillus californiensis]|uniref:YecA family protein n=1 Tax=Ornithinibacillus californiensis TaxID=161536 RepID=UPI00064DFFDA|nr:SEC-C domain-containing protein [Ornithinibacillus californiensis]
MSKLKRNEPCPCGSGKKYKKCCGSSNIDEVNPGVINTDLNRLHQDFISFAINKYEHQINERLKHYVTPALQAQKDTLDVYHSGLTTWVIFNDRFLEGNRTIFDLYLNNHLEIDRPVTKNVFTSWGYTPPSVYEVISVDKERENFATLEEIVTKEFVYVPSNLGDEFLEGSLIVSTLLPMVDYHTFAYAMVKLYRHNKEKIIDLLQEQLNKHGSLDKNFPDFLADALLIGSDAHQWENSTYEKVAQLYTEHLVEKDVPDNIIFAGIDLWIRYCLQEKPNVKKIETYAAAIEYYVQRTLLNNSSITQGQIAKEYGTSAGTVSTNYRKLTAVFDNNI